MLAGRSGTDHVTGTLIGGNVEGLRFLIVKKEEHLRAFDEKFGQPNMEEVAMKNDRGAQWMGFIHRWNYNDTALTIDCTSFGEECSVDIKTRILRESTQQNDARRQKL
jgi:hypothetical protein